MITGLAHTALHVTDVDAAVAWYRDVLGLVVLSPPYQMEGEAITRDMGKLLPAPVVVKAAIIGVDDGSDRVIEVMPGPIETDMLANSDRPPAAAAHAEYRELAERLWEGRQGIRDSYTPAAEAARRIVDAICDDDGPLRYGCDDLSEGMLAGWNSTDNARWVGGMLKNFS